MLNVKRWAEAGVSATALLALSTPAFAGVWTANPFVVYAVQSVASNGNTVAIPNGFTVTTAKSKSTTGSFQIVFTLPGGSTFGTNPTLTVAGAVPNCVPASLGPAGGGVGQTSVTYTVAVQKKATSGTCTLTLGAFTISNATALGTPPGATTTAAFQISEQIFNASPAASINTAYNEVGPTKATLAESKSALAVTDNLAPVGGAVYTIDILAPAFAKQFISSKSTNPTLVGDAGGFILKTLALQNALNTAPFTFAGTTVTLSVTAASFQNITSAFISATGTCPASAPASGVPVGTVSGNTITFAALPLTGGPPILFNGGAQAEICVVANGTGILQPSGPISGTWTIDPGLPDSVSSTSPEVSYTYNGVVSVYTYALTGSNLGAGFTSFLRLANQSPVAATIPANVWVDGPNASTSGAVASLLLENPLAGNDGDTLLFSSILSSAGLALPADGRAFIQVLLPAGVNSSMLMQNPNGTFVWVTHDAGG